MLLLKSNMKHIVMANLKAPSHLALSDLKRSKSSSLKFQSLISHRGEAVGLIILLNINRKPYMGRPMAQSD